jgi:hypothetical protein
LDDLSLGDTVVLKSPTSTVLESTYAFRSFRVCLMKFTSTVLESTYAFRSFRVCLMKLGALTSGAYMLIIFISFWCISPFISMECPSLSHLINASVKSTLR